MSNDRASSEHYYTARPQSEHRPASVSFVYRGCALRFETDSGVFSRTDVDRGTELLLDALPDEPSGAVLDMGCGYGVIGVSVGRAYPACDIVMADINERAVALAQANAQANGVRAETILSDGFQALSGRRFDLIAQNPPIRAGKRTIYAMFADAARSLRPGGAFWLVIRKRQGAESAQAYLKTIFARVEAVEKSGGYWILRCTH